MSEAAKKTRAQVTEEEITARVRVQLEERCKTQPESKTDADIRTDAEKRAESRVKARVLRDLLYRLVRDVFDDQRDFLLTSIRDCEDGDRIQAAIVQLCKVRSPDKFHFCCDVVKMFSQHH